MEPTVICSQCDDEIRQINGFWMHVAAQPRHPAIPREQPAQPNWTKQLDSRELAQIRHARDYAEKHASAGAPGHGQFILIAKMAKLLDESEAQRD